jgi:5,10-methylenetetrahydrofolate reductase
MIYSIDSTPIIPNISLEFTSPSNPMSERVIFDAANILQNFDTAFSCVNFGGDVLSPERAIMILNKLKNHYNMPVIGYLRRSNIARDTFDSIADSYVSANISTLFLTEGRRLNNHATTTDQHNSLIDAVIALKKKGNFKIAIEARPEHDNTELELIRNLVDVGIDAIITRFSFNPYHTLRFLDKLGGKAHLPKIHIGIMPLENPSKTFLTAHRLNVTVPDFIQRLFSNYPDNDTINISLGMHVLLSQTQIFIHAGYDNFHIRFGRSHEPIEALCRYYGISHNVSPHNTEQPHLRTINESALTL